jgi:hypothetical protein
MSGGVTAHARIRVLVEFPAPGNYGAGWTLDEMLKQTGKEATEALTNLLRERGGRVIGVPVIEAVLASEKR